MNNLDEVLQTLHNLADPSQLEGMARFGMTTRSRLGLSMPQLRGLAKKIGINHPLALELWQTGLAEARILAGMTADPRQLTPEQADAWVQDLDSWDVCDQLCMNLLERVPYRVERINQWAAQDAEFVRRAAFALIACLAWHDRQAPDSFFTGLFPLIEQAAADPRNYVRKAVSWALRNIGKRNRYLNEQAVQLAEQIGQQETRSARWIAADVLRELQDEKTRARLQKRSSAEPNPG